MIQFNLLPDVKMKYVRTQRIKRTVISASILLSGAALAIFIILLLTVDVWQKKTLSDLSGDIKTSSTELQKTPDLDKILTVQNQLSAINSLHQQKPVATRLAGFLSQVTPTTVTISDITADYTANTLSITGNAATLDNVNTFVDSLKFTKYQAGGSGDTLAFSDVVLSTFSRTSTGATYTITLNFDPTIFSDANDVTLIVPDIISTRSITEQPSALFRQVGQ
jgi:Tfp pilus assembly protein PilN